MGGGRLEGGGYCLCFTIVLATGYIIWFKPEWKLADPVCTFLFSILVLFSTINVLRDALRVLMEGSPPAGQGQGWGQGLGGCDLPPFAAGTPKHINYEELKQDLVAISGVKQAHSLHVWSLTMNRTAASAHLAIGIQTIQSLLALHLYGGFVL